MSNPLDHSNAGRAGVDAAAGPISAAASVPSHVQPPTADPAVAPSVRSSIDETVADEKKAKHKQIPRVDNVPNGYVGK